MNLKHGDNALSKQFKNSSDNITSVLEAHTDTRISHYTHTYDLLKIIVEIRLRYVPLLRKKYVDLY